MGRQRWFLSLSRDCFASVPSHLYCAGILWESVSDTAFQSSVRHIGWFYTRVAIPVAVGQNGKYHNYSHSSTTLYVQGLSPKISFIMVCSISMMQPPPPRAFNCFSSQLNCVLHRCWHYAYVIHTCWLFSPKTTDFHQKMKITLHNLYDQQNKVVFCVECCYSLIPVDGTRLLVAVTT